MEYRPFGATGLRVAPYALGCLNFGEPTPQAESVRIIHKALDAGINLLDTADLYAGGESERVVGRALRGGRRDKVLVATKGYFPTSADPNARGASRHHILQAAEASLRRLGTGWIDLYQIHRPDLSFPQEETLRALDDLVRQGKVRHIGCSTYPAWMVMEALALSREHGWSGFVSEQPPYNLLDRRIENELLPLAIKHGLAILPWSPLAVGLLAGRYPDAKSPPPGSRVARVGWVYEERVTEQAVAVAKKIATLAGEAGLTPAELALIWVRDQLGITAPLIGPRTEAHLDVALGTLDLRLDPDMAARLDQIVPPGGAVTNFFNNSGWMK
jgi:aryl-alcohol dehydrogenase-like predicted oxidoreductase